MNLRNTHEMWYLPSVNSSPAFRYFSWNQNWPHFRISIHERRKNFCCWYTFVLRYLGMNHLFQPFMFILWHSIQWLLWNDDISLQYISVSVALETFRILTWPLTWVMHFGDEFRDISAAWSTAPALSIFAKVCKNIYRMPSFGFSAQTFIPKLPSVPHHSSLLHAYAIHVALLLSPQWCTSLSYHFSARIRGDLGLI